MDQGLRKSAEDMNQSYEQVREVYQKSNLMEMFRRNLMEEKTIKFLKDEADITELEAVATDPKEDKIKREENS